MTLTVAIVRGDVSSPGTARTAVGDDREDITRIELKVSNRVTLRIAREPLQISRIKKIDPILKDWGKAKRVITMKGKITDDDTNSIDAVYLEGDLEYAANNWWENGLVTVEWDKDAAGAYRRSKTGYIKTLDIEELTNFQGVYEFTLSVVIGELKEV